MLEIFKVAPPDVVTSPVNNAPLTVRPPVFPTVIPEAVRAFVNVKVFEPVAITALPKLLNVPILAVLKFEPNVAVIAPP